MKEETNNEMDLLLRRLGRRPDIAVSDGNGDVEHLDADELSAYAENVLPAAARARYTEHLAECARCRDLVVQLSSSAGVVPVVAKTPAPSALRKFLASLFSPMVLRYAVPALGLILVAAIGVFVLRQKQSAGESVAQNTEAQKSKSIVTPSPSEPAAKSFYDQQSKEPAVATRPAQNSASPQNQSAGAAPAAPPPAAVDQPSQNSVAKKEEQPAIETKDSAIGPPKPAASDSREQQAKAEPRQEASPAEEAKVVAADKVTVQDRKAEVETERTAAAKNKAPSSVAGIASLRAGAAAPQSQEERDDEAGKDKQSAETKIVAGRRFRKQNGVWVDTAYDSSRSVLTVSRGSETYRALIADEPEIKKIAEQLKGEILVVWKDRIYRIR